MSREPKPSREHMVLSTLSILVLVGLFKVNVDTLGLFKTSWEKTLFKKDLESSFELENIKIIWAMGVGELLLISSNCFSTSLKSDYSFGR
jgi:hypothetical protein